ncbi:MAG: hypothetical protein U0441_07860 [Polyangiaceae bacterium]
MLYQEATHSKVKIGQLWRCTLPVRLTVLIVAVDSCPGGLVINALLEDGVKNTGVDRVLAPTGWQHLEPYLVELLDEGIDVSEHLASYNEWKQLAEDGKAGYFTSAPADVLSTLRNAIRR